MSERSERPSEARGAGGSTLGGFVLEADPELTEAIARSVRP